MSEGFCEAIDKCSNVLKLDFSSSEFARIAEEQAYSIESVATVNDVFAYICAKKEQAIIQMLMKTSRLPMKHPKTFENFDFNVLKGKDIERLRSLPSLAASTRTRTLRSSAQQGQGRHIGRWRSGTSAVSAA